MEDVALYGHDLFGDPIEAPWRGELAKQFLVPPFSVLNAREGFWQERKRAWIGMGIKSEIGRDDDLTYASIAAAKAKYDEQAGSPTKEMAGTSIFDPVLCELMYEWFCPKEGRVLDPFAGGSVRGMLASKLGRVYIGIELSERQVAANDEQWHQLKTAGDIMPWWINDDSLNMAAHDITPVDMVFSCPPYADLEVYSDHPQDISNMTYDKFLDAYMGIIMLACERLKPNRFAVWVVSEVRDKATGNFRNFVGDTIQAFKLAGMHYYNEIILMTPCGSLPVRMKRQFDGGRKIGRSHQNVLVFVKGDGKKATKEIAREEE